MVHRPEGKQGFESSKVCHIVIPYTQGKCLDIGCGLKKCWPGMIGLDNLKDYGGQRPPDVDVVGDALDLSLFSDASMDGVFSSHYLEHVEDTEACLKEWWRVIKPGGYLTLYLPHKSFYPNIGTPLANTDHKHDFVPDDIINIMKKIGSWELLENEDRNKFEEYSMLLVFKKLEDKYEH